MKARMTPRKNLEVAIRFTNRYRPRFVLIGSGFRVRGATNLPPVIAWGWAILAGFCLFERPPGDTPVRNLDKLTSTNDNQ